MKKQVFFILCLLSLFSLNSCGIMKELFVENPSTNKPTGNTNNSLESITIEGPSNAVTYINRYKAVAVSEMNRTGVPASIKLAQGILESGYGSSELAKKANNHFGMKCGSQWSGKKYQLKGSCYRAFSNAEQGFKEHSEFLKRPHYSDLFKLKKTDYKGWARGLQKAGYATDKNYPNKLIELIERFKLYRFDQLG